MSMYVSEIRDRITELLDRCETESLPVPYSIEPDGDLGIIKVSWMLQDKLEESKKVLTAFGPWTIHQGSTAREPILEHEVEHGAEHTIWPHPGALVLRVETT